MKIVQTVVEEEANIRGCGKKATEKNAVYQKILYTFRDGERTFPIHLILKVSISECSVDDDLITMRFHSREGMPLYDNLQIELIQLVHDSTLKGHPGHESIYTILARKYFGPNMAMNICKFTDNCDSCEANKVGRHRRQGLLKPLSVLNRTGGKISMDFITDLLNSDDYTNMIVIINRLSKGIITDGLEDITSATVAKWFLGGYFLYHSLSYAIVSDRGI